VTDDPALPERLAALHLGCSPGDVVTLEGDVPDDLVVGAGFERVDARRARRLHTLPDRVGPSMRLLVCGLNPSLYSAERGIGFARPGNRFWPALLEAGLATVDREPGHALHHHGIGMTDLVKRATTAAAELTTDEYAAGVERVARLCAWLRPGAVCMVGLAGWRAAVDRRATVGWQSADLGGVGVYVMPSTSGLNASTQLPGFIAHLRAAAGGTPGSHRPDR
jgi:TDG/mug DNA glycosylase family protein